MNFANTVNLSSGQILFGDPTQPWDRRTHHLPIPNLVVTSYGTNETASISTLALPNKRKYEPFEPSTIQNSLTKTLLIDSRGTVTYGTPKLNTVSTQNSFFSTGITQFTPNTIAGPNIQDGTTSNPDTITNALAKLDDWLKNAFLIQPPAVSQVEQQNTSLFAGTRWNNFVSYNIMNGTMPHVTSILITIGDPNSDNLTFEWSDPSYFPLQQYTNGVSPVLNPLVQLRIFTDFTPTLGNVAYTKAGLDSSCFRLINNSGACELPNIGPVFTIEQTDHNTTYTTLNIYLPNLPNVYPKDEQIPIQVTFMNKTNPQYNTSYMSATITSTGGPSAPVFTVSPGSNSLNYTIQPPTFSDEQHERMEPYISTYRIGYQWNSWVSAYDTTTGFLYGAQSINDITSTYSTLYKSPQFYDIPAYASTLISNEVGNPLAPFLPSANWSTTVTAINSAHIVGDTSSIPLFSQTDILSTYQSTIQGITLRPNAPFISHSTYNLNYTDSWDCLTSRGYDIAFTSTPTKIPIQLQNYVQFNNYQGDRDPIKVSMNYGNQSTFLLLSTYNNDYTFSTPYILNQQSGIMVDIQDTHYSHLFYQTQITGLPTLSTSQSTMVSLSLQNTQLIGGRKVRQTQQSASYGIGVEPVQPFKFISASYLSTATSTTYISGVLTPALNSYLQFKASQSNQMFSLAASTIGSATLIHNNQPTADPTYYMSSIVMVDALGSPYTQVPLPENVEIFYSTLHVAVGTMFQDPTNPLPYSINVNLRSPYPQGTPQSKQITIDNSLYIDTLSQVGQQSNRIIGLIPRTDISTNQYNIYDGVSTNGATDIGLNISYSSFITLSTTFSTTILSTLQYDESQSLLNPYPNTYSRELMFLGGRWINPVQITFSSFSGSTLNQAYTYPDFTYDLVYDQNNGFRYGTFLFQTTPSTPTPYRYVNVYINNPNYVSTLNISTNVAFPNTPVDAGFLQSAAVKLHLKFVASYDAPGYQQIETSWVNGFKYLDDYFDDSVYDIGGCTQVSTYISSVSYKVAITPRYYTNIAALVRVGISRNRQQDDCDWLSFTDINVEYLED